MTRETLYTEGRYLCDRYGERVVLRGVNIPLFDDWNFPGSDALGEIEKTGANALRIQWYVNHPNPDRPPVSPADLDDFLQRCAAANIIPILMLADLTCVPDAAEVNSRLIPWWVSSEFATVLTRHSKYLIINPANEAGTYRRARNSKAALAAYAKAYQAAISSLRENGLEVPIMIDAPDCGTSLDAFLVVGRQLIEADRCQNLLLSAHAYWGDYDGIPHLAQCINAELPIVFGEIANKQDRHIDGKVMYCYYDLDGSKTNHRTRTGFTYQTLLTLLQENEVGWLAWSWGPDNCTPRCLSQDGSFASLTAFGQDVVNNPVYGLAVAAGRSRLIT